jgi:hypothetical protein
MSSVVLKYKNGETASPEALPQQITVVVLYFIDITDQMTFQDIAEILLNFALSTN